jgi:hypothetical protein
MDGCVPYRDRAENGVGFLPVLIVQIGEIALALVASYATTSREGFCYGSG